jgi:polyisoprenoid-binding protein YceI
MRKITTGVILAFACLGAMSASAENFRLDDAHAAAEFGIGGWTQTFQSRPFASGAIALVKTEVTVTRSDRGLDAGDFDRRLHRFDADADCLFAPAMAIAGHPRRAGCK